MNEETLFAEALAIESEEERRRFIDAACNDNQELRKAVARLLDLAQGAGSFLEHPPLEAATDLAAGSDATSLVGDVSTADETDAGESGPSVTGQHPSESDGDISLSFLRPATRKDSLGRLGHYEILNVVGKGSFGTVLRAFDTKLERIVAVKVLALELASLSPARKRFLREARTSAQVRHDNVVAVYSVEEEPLPYLVMEYIPGKTLQQQLDEHGPLDVPSVLRLGKQIADGLAAAHAQGLIHRDIKPGNILLDGGMEERIKITDFGLARTADDASMTQSGMIAGTPLYMAPEQARGQKLDQRADLFSFGSVLYQMLSGRPPFRAATTVAVLKRVVEDNPRPIQEVIPEVPEWMSSVVDHLLAKDPDQRYRSAREVSELLERCATEIQAGRVPTIPRPSSDSPSEVLEAPCDDSAAVRQRGIDSRRGRQLLKIAVVLAILVAVLGATEATGITRLAGTVIRLATGSGTLIIETDDPGLKISINGEEVTIAGGGIEELTLRPGQYQLAALKDGQSVQQELVSITRNGRTVVRIKLDSAAKSDRAESPKVNGGWHGWPAEAPRPAVTPFDTAQAKQHQEQWAQYLQLPVEYVNSLGMRFRLIPPGEFLMGSTAEEMQELLAINGERRLREIYLSYGPQHHVVITQPYYLGLHEVTQKQYQHVVGQNPSSFSAHGPNRERVAGQDTDDFPVEQVSWNDAAAFCSRLSQMETLRPFDFQQLDRYDPSASSGYRLPTEAEWEAACRAGTSTLYWTGDQPAGLLDTDWIDVNSNQQPHAVGELRANPYGLYDIQGNIQELVLDQWHRDYYAQFQTRTAVDPTGPASGRGRVTRGGRYAAPAVTSRCSKRGVFGPDQVAPIVGFRVALPINAVRQAIAK